MHVYVRLDFTLTEQPHLPRILQSMVFRENHSMRVHQE